MQPRNYSDADLRAALCALFSARPLKLPVGTSPLSTLTVSSDVTSWGFDLTSSSQAVLSDFAPATTRPLKYLGLAPASTCMWCCPWCITPASTCTLILTLVTLSLSLPNTDADWNIYLGYTPPLEAWDSVQAPHKHSEATTRGTALLSNFQIILYSGHCK